MSLLPVESIVQAANFNTLFNWLVGFAPCRSLLVVVSRALATSRSSLTVEEQGRTGYCFFSTPPITDALPGLGAKLPGEQRVVGARMALADRYGQCRSGKTKPAVSPSRQEQVHVAIQSALKISSQIEENRAKKTS